MRRLPTIAAILLVLASPAIAKPNPPTAAPSFTLSTFSASSARQGTVALDSLRGKTVLLDFWASWCEPCRLSFPWMNEMHRRYASKGLVIVAVNLDKDPELAKGFLSKLPAEFTVAFDASGKTAESYRVKAMPTSILISPDGKILATHAGFDPRRAAEYETMIATALPQ